MLQYLSDSDLRIELKINSKIHRKYILEEIKLLSRENNSIIYIDESTNIFPSQILSNLRSNCKSKRDYIFSILPKIYRIKLIYNAQKHGFSAEEFHKRCDIQASTLLIAVTTTGHIFGAYSPIPWLAADPGKYNVIGETEVKRSFLFNVDERKVFHYINGTPEVYFHKDFGPTFGEGFDLKIEGNGRGFANLGWSYELPHGVVRDTQKSRELLAGEFIFQLLNYEVFRIYHK